MHEDLEQLKRRIPLLQYLQRRRWTGNRVGAREEFVGLCPLRRETKPPFYVNVSKNLFYCHGCQRGGDLIRFVELSEHLSFRESVACLQRQIAGGGIENSSPGQYDIAPIVLFGGIGAALPAYRMVYRTR